MRTTDVDGDGFDVPEDCDDGDPAIFPGAPDTWYDGVDSDCDDAYDFDADGDGQGAIAYWGLDCDDADPNRYSGAPRICGNVVDDDCDALPDCDLRGDGMAEDLAAGVFTGTANSDAGDWTDAGDVDGDGNPDLLLASAETDQALLFDGPLLDVREAAAADAALSGGASGATFGDFDGDGLSDVAATVSGIAVETTTRIWTAGNFDDALPAAQLVHDFNTGDAHRVEGADLDDDGIDELILGGLWGCQVTGWSAPGCIEIFEGPVSGVFDDSAVATMVLAEADDPYAVLMPGVMGLDGSHDLTGDGLADLALSDSIIGIIGKFYVVDSPLPAVASLDDALVTMVPDVDPINPTVANGVATGDLDGDGYSDLILGTAAVGGVRSGFAWVFRGPLTQGLLEPAGAAVTIPDVNVESPTGVAVMGDFDGNGLPDLALSNDDGSLPADYASSSIAMYYEPQGTAVPDFVLHDSQWGPSGIAVPGDVDHDGIDDLLASSPEVLDPGGITSGGAYLILGRATGY